MDTTERVLSSPPVPTSLVSGELWTGRGLLESASVPRGPRLATPAGGINPGDLEPIDAFLLAVGFVTKTTAAVRAGSDEAAVGTVSAVGGLQVEDTRAADSLDGTNGGGSAPECSNNADDDSDGLIDFGSDDGCLSTMDTTESLFDFLVTLPGDGGSNTNFSDHKPRFAEMPVGSTMGYRAEFNPVLHSSFSVNHAGVAISGTPLCTGATTEISAGAGSQAPTTSPTGNPLPPAPDENHIRIVIDMSDPLGADPCTGTVTVRVAVDTR